MGKCIDYQFVELECFTPTGEVELSPREAERIKALRANYPEIASWRDAAINEAWYAYSQDCWLVSILDVAARDTWFLGYLYQLGNGSPVGRWNGDTERARIGFAELEGKNLQ